MEKKKKQYRFYYSSKKNDFLGHDANPFDPHHLMYWKAKELPLFLLWLQNGIKIAFREL